MNKVNYQKEMEKIIGRLESRPTLFLHSCCAPCSSYCMEYTREYFDVTDEDAYNDAMNRYYYENAEYEKMLSDLLSKVMEDSASPLHNFLDKEALSQFLSNPKDYGAPWYGQLMCGPQMIAYLLQIDFWIREYQIDLRI